MLDIDRRAAKSFRWRRLSAWDKCSCPQSNCSLNFHQQFFEKKKQKNNSANNFSSVALHQRLSKDGEENYWSIKNPIFLFCQFVSLTSDWHWELQWTKRGKKARMKWERGRGGEQVTAIGWITHEWAHHTYTTIEWRKFYDNERVYGE